MNLEDQVDRKRPRIEYEREAAAAAAARRAEADNPYTNHPTLYMDDGNIIMKCTSSTTLFRVHRSILSKHSTVLDALFKTAASQQPPRKLRECLFVEVGDDKDDLAGLLVAIYDGFHVTVPEELTVETFPSFAGLLRVTTKYRIDRVRQLLINRLHEEWPSALDKHDAKVSAFSTRYLTQQNMDDTIVHPASVIALLHDCSYTPPDLMGPLFYDLSKRTWQFGGEATGHHLAPLTPSDMEKFIVGMTKLRSAHVKSTEAPLHIITMPTCKAVLLPEWLRRVYATLYRSNNFMCTPIEDWSSFLATLKTSAPWVCRDCHALLIKHCEQMRTHLWTTVLDCFT
ncbi:BTB domain-containing protein [Pleurotus pulmonarius]